MVDPGGPKYHPPYLLSIPIRKHSRHNERVDGSNDQKRGLVAGIQGGEIAFRKRFGDRGESRNHRLARHRADGQTVDESERQREIRDESGYPLSLLG